LRCGAHRLAEIGAVQEKIEQRAEQHGDGESDQLRHREIDGTDMERQFAVGSLYGPVISGEQQ
jgi:hypothetical protein